MLGPLEVRSGEETLPLGGAKQRALLAILLLHANHVVSRERLAELLWGDEPPPTADHVIEVYVSQLRRVLEPAGAPYKVLLRKPAGYLLQVPPSDIDTAQFASLVESAKTFGPGEAVAQLQRALDMWRGPALADFAGEPFVLSEAARLDELRLYAIEERIEAELKLGHHARLIGELQGLVEQHPLRERLCGQLMLALYRSGRQAEASDVYQKTRERLVDELGMEPGPELQDLLKRILQQESGLAAAEVAAPSLPSGTMTFLLTDVEGSTRRWDRNPAAMQAAMQIHDAVLGRVINAHSGMQVESGREGDSILAVFRRASDALACAIEVQTSLASERWPEGADLHIRVAIHTGEAELRGGHYFGPTVYRCARLLATGFGDQVLLTQATHDVVVDTLSGGIALRDLGMHRLRDLERPERIFQLTAPGLRSEFPPLNSLDPRRHNLPISPTPFIGRETELAEIRERLERTRMLTLIGAGGTGKTRLAMQAAAETSDRFKDGVWLVELAPLRETELVVQTIAETLGIREEAGRPISRVLSDALRSKDLLLVIDNCEHLIRPVVTIADQLLHDCARIKLLATSRAALRVNGESIMRIGSLDDDDALALFAGRAGAVQPGFRLTPESTEQAIQICRRVEGIPLAIELAAGRARMMATSEILSRLQKSFTVLAGGSRSAESRHETLQAAIDWSYWLLNESEQSLFRRLAVFFGGFTLDAAEAICSGEGVANVLELLGQLVDKSLVTPQQTSDGSTRYTMLETVREYGRARLLEHQELEALQARHASYFGELVEATRDRIPGPERRKWLAILGAEVDNLRSIFDLTTESPEAKLALASGMTDFWETRGEYSEGRSRLESALARSIAPSRMRAEALSAVGTMAWAQGDLSAALSYTRQALELSRELGDTQGEASSLQQLGQLAVQREEYEVARGYLEDALRLAAANGYDRIRALSEWRLGLVALFTSDLDGANAHFETSLSLASALGDGETQAMSHMMLGNIALRQNRLGEAKAHLVSSLEIQRAEGSSRTIANLFESLAAAEVATGHVDRAIRLGGAAEGLRRRIDIVPTSRLHRDISQQLEEVRRGAGAEQSWNAGMAMTREEAIRYALDEGESSTISDETSEATRV